MWIFRWSSDIKKKYILRLLQRAYWSWSRGLHVYSIFDVTKQGYGCTLSYLLRQECLSMKRTITTKQVINFTVIAMIIAHCILGVCIPVYRIANNGIAEPPQSCRTNVTRDHSPGLIPRDTWWKAVLSRQWIDQIAYCQASFSTQIIKVASSCP